MSTQARTARAGAAPTALMYTRPWRSSPLAGPGFSTLPPIISESSEEADSHQQDLSAPESLHEFGQSRSQSSSSIVSHASASASASGYGASASASALLLFESEASRSSISLSPSTSAHGTGTSSSHGHGNPRRPARLSKSWARRPSSAYSDAPPRNVAEDSITPLPRARTTSRPASYAGPSLVPSPSMPAAYSRNSNIPKQPPSVSRDPASNWMSSTPFGPAVTPKFSRLSMASPAVVMPLSAREYRKRRTRDPHGKSKENDTPLSPNSVAFVDNAVSAFKSPNNVPSVKVSPPPSEEPQSSPSDPQPRAGHTPKPFPQSARPKARYSHSRSRSRPGTPPRSSPLAAPPISPKSSATTFFSVASNPDADAPFPVPPNGQDAPPSMSPAGSPTAPNAAVSPRPRPRLRRKSYPERISNGTRLSLTEAMNRLSQESSSLHHLSEVAQVDNTNRLSVVSQASGHTLFYDVDSEDGQANVSRHGSGKSTRAPALHTQSLEDLSSALARTGIEVVNRADGLVETHDAPKGNRNVRMVRISDQVEVSPAPVHRPRKLTKSRPGSIRVSAAKETNGQGHQLERRASLLPWRSKGTGDNKGGVANAAVADPVERISGENGPASILPQETAAPIPVPSSLIPGVKPSSHVEARPKLTPNDAPTKPLAAVETSPRKTRRSTFSFLSSSTFPLSRRQKSATLPAIVDLGLDKDTHTKSKGNPTDGTSTSIRTITQGSQSTLTLGSHGVYDLTTLASSGGLSGGTGASTVPMLRRLNAQETELAGMDRLPSPWETKGDSTPSLITNSSIGTTSSAPPTPLHARQPGLGEPFVSRPSGLKESFTDTSEDDSEGVQGRGKTSRTCMHRRLDPSPLARAGVSESEEEEGIYVCTHSSPGLLSPSPRRPGTPNSLLTMTTETSASYASLSTVPTTVTSSSATSRSTSPSLSSPGMGGRRALAPQPEEEDGDGYACALCGHVASRSTSPASFGEAMHPMFTVPLVTVPASAVSRTRSANGRVRRVSSGARAGYHGERHPHSPVPVAAAVSVANKDHGPVTTGGHKTMTETMSPTKMKKRRRPQTAPASVGDTPQFLEQSQTKHVDDRLTKPKSGHSRFKSVLKGLFKWNT